MPDTSSNHSLALRLRAYAEVMNTAPSGSPEEQHALTATASDLLEAARRLDQNHERQRAK